MKNIVLYDYPVLRRMQTDLHLSLVMWILVSSSKFTRCTRAVLRASTVMICYDAEDPHEEYEYVCF